MQARILQSILDSTAEGIAVADANGTLLLLNPAAERILGMGISSVPPEERARHYGLYLPDKVTLYPSERMPLIRALRGESVDREVVFVRNAARPAGLWVDVSTRPLRDPDGAVAGVVITIRDITEDRRAREEIQKLNVELHQRAREHEAKYRLAAQAANNAIWDWDLSTNRCVWNDALEHLFGYPPDEVGDTIDWCFGLVHPEDRERVHVTLSRVIDSGGTTWSQEYRFRRKDGSYAHVLDRAYVVRDAGGCPARLVGAVQDLSDQKRAEGALRESEERFRTLTESALAGVYIIQEGRFQYVNPALARMFGYEPGEMIGKLGPLDLTYFEDRAAARDYLRLRLEGQVEAVHYETRGVRKDGAIIHCEILGRRMEYQGHVAIVGMLLDITDRRRAEEELRKERDFNKCLVETSPAFILTLDPAGRVLTMNQAALNSLGYTLEQVVGQDYLPMFVPPEERAALAEVFRRQVELRGSIVSENHLLTRDGRRLLTEWRGQPVFKSRGELDYLFGIGLDITERKRAELALRESEQRFRAMADSAPVYIWIADTSKRCTYFNKSWLEFTGRTQEEEMGFGWSNNVHPDDRPGCLARYDSAFDARRPFSLEYRLRRFDGQYRWMFDIGTPRFTADGAFAGYIGSCMDITERKEAEAELARSVSLLEATFESTADGLLVVDTQGRIVNYNQKFVQMWGIPDEIIASHDDRRAIGFVLDQLADPTAFMAKVESLYARPDAESFDVLLFKDGRVFERYSQPHRLGKEIIGRVWSFRDVTQRHHAEASLHREREFLRALLANVSEGIVACDAGGTVTLCNPSAQEGYQVAEQPVPPQRWPEHFHLFQPDGVTPLRSAEVPLYRALQGEHVRNAEVVVLPPGRSAKNVLVSGNAIIGPDGQNAGAVVVMHDITERNRLQHQLLQAQKLESIGTLAGGIAHDFNNLLAVILGNASVHLRNEKLPRKIRESLADIVAAAERGSALTHQLLAYSRGGLQTLGPTDLNALVRSVLHILRRTTPLQIEFVLDLAPELPPISADPNQIEQVIMNLSLNAIQATEGPGKVEISTRTQWVEDHTAERLELPAGGYACLQVRDSGCGMDAQTLERIFEPFYTTKFTGRGMGLAASLGIIQSHHGQIRAESVPGQGARFSIWLPMVKEPAGERPATRSPARRSRLAPGSETVLIIDDDPAVARAVEQMLSSLGYCVIAHTEPDRALSFLQNNSEDIEVVVLDLNLPKYSAADMYAAIRSRCGATPILLASGFDSPEMIRALRQEGAAGFLQKPFDMASLSATIRKALDEAGAHATGNDGPHGRPEQH